jgi:STAM-binding protein
MAFAAANTARNQETCAVLCGKVDLLGAFRITHAILPKQVGAADRVTTSHEEELFNTQIELDVLTLGWIHTHPTQTCFLSSVDLHTQYSYQVMMPEAVAIVCAPKYNAVGYFSVTSTGMPVLQSCSQRGFHQHNQAGLYDNAAHVLLDSTGQAPCKFVDLR